MLVVSSFDRTFCQLWWIVVGSWQLVVGSWWLVVGLESGPPPPGRTPAAPRGCRGRGTLPVSRQGCVDVRREGGEKLTKRRNEEKGFDDLGWKGDRGGWSGRGGGAVVHMSSPHLGKGLPTLSVA